MIETNIFDKEIKRSGTSCIKWDFMTGGADPEKLLPFSIADSDWKTVPEVIDVLQERVAHGIFGYSAPGKGYYEALAHWYRQRHQVDLKEEWIVPTAGVVPSISLAVMLFTGQDDGVILQPPVYDPFYSVIEANHRKILCNDLKLTEEGYQMDYQDLEEKLRSGAKMLILCNPHNPVGRVWKREELEACAALCERYDAILVSDEIHGDLGLCGNAYFSVGRLEKYRNRMIICTAPSKTFNIAGLGVSNIIIPDERLRSAYSSWLQARYQTGSNLLGMLACQTAYEKGAGWVDAELRYLSENYLFLREYFERRIPAGKVADLEGTYLAWIDFTSLKKSSDVLCSLFSEKGVIVNSGAHYGANYDGFIRLNFACPRGQLERGLSAIETAVKEEVR